MTTDESIGDPIPDVFDPARIDARFVVAMSMARNDIEVALRDGIAAAEDDRPDFGYCVRLATSHLVEALDSLNAYSQDEDVKKLMARVPVKAGGELSRARSVLQKVGPKVRDQVPTTRSTSRRRRPTTARRPTSASGTYWRACARGHARCTSIIVVNTRSSRWASQATRPSRWPSPSTRPTTQFELTSDGAVAFTHWADALVIAYLEATGGYVGTPRVIDYRPPTEGNEAPPA